MVNGWRRAFCTSVPKERDITTVLSEKQQRHHSNNGGNSTNNHSPKITKFGFFSNPSTPRLQSQPVSSPSLRCRPNVACTSPTSSVASSPILQRKAAPTTPPKKSNSPTFFQFSNPSPPKSPSSFSLLKATLRLSKSRCGICLQSVKSGQGTAVFTAECSHVFHFPCVASHVKRNQLLICPVCNASWKELPIHQSSSQTRKEEKILINEVAKTKNLRVYNDDEPLRSPSPGSLFNPIPELEENDVDEENDNSVEDFQGFFVNAAPVKVTDHVMVNPKNVEVSLLPESAVVAIGRNFETQVVVMKVRAPPFQAALGMTRRPHIDLVAVLDVSENMCGVKLQIMKRAMRFVISSLGSTDRLSIVVFSASSKRLLPLRRMTVNGRRSAHRIVDALGSAGQGMSAIDALKKATKVIEDRREKNSVTSIIILSNRQDDRSHINSFNHKRSSPLVSSTRFSHLEIPVHSFDFGEYTHVPTEDELAKCVSGLLSVVVQDVKLQLGFIAGSAPADIAAVYSPSGRLSVFGPGSIRIGDLHAEEERELLVELKVPASSLGSHLLLSVRSSFRDPSSQELIFSKERSLLVPRAQAVRSSLPNIQRLRRLHVTTRAVAESRRLMGHNDFSGAYNLLTSTRSLLMKSSDQSAGEYLRGLEAELSEMHRRRQHLMHSQRKRSGQEVEEKQPEPLTPTSAWRAAERLAKVAIMRKHMNRVSDLHGFENARF